VLTTYLINNLRLVGFHRDDIRVIPWGIDVQQFYYLDKSLRLPYHFLHIGNLHPVKDQETLLRAFRLICDAVDARLTIIGEGILLEKLKELIDTLHLTGKVTIRGLVPYKELPAFYHDADFLLHTSLSEGQCEVVTEAMSAGTLVFGTKVGLMYDLPDCCLAVDVRDYAGLANAILDALKDPDKLWAQRTYARSWSERHSILWTVEELAKVYES
jgi:glycosyltransferase involved in cell wall biosynthesis